MRFIEEKMKKEYPKIYLYKRVVLAKMFIDSHFAKSLDLTLVSDEASFSKFHFIRLFKKIYGMTPHHYLRKVRIGQAKKYLEEGRSAVESCELVGFESIGTFTSLFKKEVGDTPSSYQQKQYDRQHKMSSRPIQFIPNCFALRNGLTKYSNFKEVS
jgi:AraC-like DNA-binding protein